MKRILTITLAVLVVLAVLSLTACGDKVPVGNYYADGAEGKWQDAEIQVHEDGSATMILHEDGAMKVSGVSFKNGKLTGGKDTYSYTCKDGVLTLKTDDGDVAFKTK